MIHTSVSLMGMSDFVEFESNTGIVLLEHDIYNLGGSELSRGTAVITHTHRYVI